MGYILLLSEGVGKFFISHFFYDLPQSTKQSPGHPPARGFLLIPENMSRDFAKAFYASADWQKMREYILIRDKYKCTRCGRSGNLEVHHIKHLTPENIHDAAVTLNDANLTTLCRDCHFEVHTEDRARGNHEHNAQQDCADGFRFDENGYLVPLDEK